MNHYFDNAFKQLLKNEGIYSNHPLDKGGQTIFGITKQYHEKDFEIIYNLWKSGNIVTATEYAKMFYKKKYWNRLFEQIPDTSMQFKLFDLSVNLGSRAAIKIFKNVLSNHFGLPMGTNNQLDQTTLELLLRLYSCGMGEEIYARFVTEVEKHYKRLKAFSVFGKGWIKRLYCRHFI